MLAWQYALLCLQDLHARTRCTAVVLLLVPYKNCDMKVVISSLHVHAACVTRWLLQTWLAFTGGIQVADNISGVILMSMDWLYSVNSKV